MPSLAGVGLDARQVKASVFGKKEAPCFSTVNDLLYGDGCATFLGCELGKILATLILVFE